MTRVREISLCFALRNEKTKNKKQNIQIQSRKEKSNDKLGWLGYLGNLINAALKMFSEEQDY